MSSLRNAYLLSFFIAAISSAQEVRLTTRPLAPPAPAQASELALSGVVAAATCAEQEPNESTTAASSTSVPSLCTGNAGSADSSSIRIDYGDGVTDGIEDIFVLNLTVPAKLTMDLTNSSSADLDLFLFTWSGSSPHFIAISNHDGSGVAEKIALANPVAAGTYYVGVSAFSGSSSYTLSLSAPGYSATCSPDLYSLCLSNGRFRVQADWGTTDGKTGKGQGVLLTHETGYFWFFADTNVEVTVKVLDACGLNSRFWVFSGGMTDVNVPIRITDTVTGVTRTYANPISTLYRTISDTDAFATCNGSTCTYSVSPAAQDFSSSAGTGSIAVTATAGCSWTATPEASWITIASGASGEGNGSVSYAVAANAGTSSRTGTISIASKVVTITQAAASAGCTYGVSPASKSFTASGGTGSLVVTTPGGCAWTASTNDGWITITSGASGSGNGTVGYSVAANASSSARSGTITAAGQTVAITQSGAGSSGDYDGTWNGVTNEGEIVGFTIASGKVTMFKMSFSFGVPGNSCTTTITMNFGASSQPALSGNGFAFNFNPTGLQTSINVTFGSNTSGTGTYGQVNLNNFRCGPATINGYKSGGTFTVSK